MDKRKFVHELEDLVGKRIRVAVRTGPAFVREFEGEVVGFVEDGELKFVKLVDKEWNGVILIRVDSVVYIEKIPEPIEYDIEEV